MHLTFNMVSQLAMKQILTVFMLSYTCSAFLSFSLDLLSISSYHYNMLISTAIFISMLSFSALAQDVPDLSMLDATPLVSRGSS